MQKHRMPVYTGENLDHIAFPLGGIGAGMFCIEGNGSFGSVSFRNAPDLFHEPCTFSALSVRQGEKSCARIIEGQVPRHKIFGTKGTLSGLATNYNFGKTYGLPRFRDNSFRGEFPYAFLEMQDEEMPLQVSVTAFSPFLPLNPDDSSLPAATVIYTFENRTQEPAEAVYSFNTFNFMLPYEDKWFPMNYHEEVRGTIQCEEGGLSLYGDDPSEGSCRIFADDADAVLHNDWFQGAWFDTLTMRWKEIRAGKQPAACREDGKTPGGTISVPFVLQPGEKKSIPVHFTWYVPDSDLRIGYEEDGITEGKETYHPWYSARFGGAGEVMTYYRENYKRLEETSANFRDALFSSDLPGQALEALGANLSILKSPTVLRQTDGRLWAWEGCCDTIGSCHGSCTHVWNYAQALAHLFPSLERSFRNAEFHEDQNGQGHQEFRSSLPIRESGNSFHAASDGQLGGIMKMYREWRICGDLDFIRTYWPLMKKSMDYCIRTWDVKREGVLKEPHHNTYDIEFWGADGMCSTFYLGALKAISRMGEALGEPIGEYRQLYQRGRQYVETELFNGEYFIQKTEWKDLQAKLELSKEPASSRALMEHEGPKYQYGEGCISDGVLGDWLARMCGLGEVLDPEKVKSHLLSVYRYNFKKDLRSHENPQRPGYALGAEGGLLLCTWPRGGQPSLPFVYSDEVWTGIEHHVAAHLMMFGCVKEAGEIIAASRQRYDGKKRNPYDEYECGHWYARALSSYGYLQSFTGVRYDAAEKTLYVSHQNAEEYTVFLCTESGYGTVTVHDEAVEIHAVEGEISPEKIVLQ